jgi:ATP-binding cassette, subfamily B, bacterial
MKEKISLFRESLKLVWRSAPGWALANFVIAVFISIFPLILIWLLKLVIDAITVAAASGSGADTAKLLLPVIALVSVWFINEALSDMAGYIRKKQSVRLEGYMYDLLHTKAAALDLITFERPEYFDRLSRAAREAPWRPNSILNNLIAMLRALLSLLLMAVLITSLNLTMTLLLIAANIPGIWLRLHYAEVLYSFRKKQTPEARKTAYFSWLLTGDRPSREIRLFGLGNYFIDLFKRSFRRQKEEETEILRKRTIIELLSDLFKSAAFLIMLLYISDRTISGILSLGQMAMFLLAFRQGMIYIKELFISMGSLYEDSLFIGDVFEFLNLQESITAALPVAIPSALDKEIIAHNLSFTYPGNTAKTISNISFGIKKGEIVAIVGPNGAGKSTLVRLLCRLYDPDSGSLLYDGTDIRRFDPGLYRKMFSVVFQDFMLYNLTAGENIRLGNINEEYPTNRIRSSAASTGIHELISALPKGYDTVIGNLFDDSAELSWGEWQKMALARAIFRDAPVLILDEPSSALDANTEYEIFSRFRDIVKGRTSILISHRFGNVSLADRIIVLDKGSIAETGSHEELMEKKGIYFAMFTRQTARLNKS